MSQITTKRAGRSLRVLLGLGMIGAFAAPIPARASSPSVVASSAAPAITTMAGGIGGPDPGTDVSVQLNRTNVSATGGYVYVTNGILDNLSGAVYQLNEKTDWVVPLAGPATATSGYDTNGTPALATSLQASQTVTDAYGNLLMAEPNENVIRIAAARTGTYYGAKVTAGRVYTIAGTSHAGFSGDGGPARDAQLNYPSGVVLDHAGNVLIGDSGNGRIRVVAAKNGKFYGQQMRAGDIYTIFDGGSAIGTGVIAVDHWGNLAVIVPTPNNETAVAVIAEASGNFYGQPMTAGHPYTIVPAFIGGVTGLAVDAAGNLLFGTDTQVQVVAARNGFFYGEAMAAGRTYTLAGDGNYYYNGNAIPALQAAIVPTGVTVDGWGNVVIAANGLARVVPFKAGTYYGMKMKAAYIYTVAGIGETYSQDGSSAYSGDGGLATSAELGVTAAGITNTDGANPSGIDAAGNILIADIIVGAIHVVARSTGTFYGQKMTRGDIYTISTNRSSSPPSVVVDGRGNVVIAEQQLYWHGWLTVLAERDGTDFGVNMQAGHSYTLATGSIGFPNSVQLDHYGNLLISSSLSSTSGPVYVMAARTGTFYGQQMTVGGVYHVAGGEGGANGNGIPAVGAYLDRPAQTVVDAAGNLLIADAGSDTIRVVAANTGTYYGQAMKAGDIYTIAGTGSAGPPVNGIPALQASLSKPEGVAVDKAGNVLIADTDNNEVRVVAAKTGTYYGQPMKAGDIYLLAGTGQQAFGGDGGLASKAAMTTPTAVTVLPDGGILVSDDGRIRLIRLGP